MKELANLSWTHNKEVSTLNANIWQLQQKYAKEKMDHQLEQAMNASCHEKLNIEDISNSHLRHVNKLLATVSVVLGIIIAMLWFNSEPTCETSCLCTCYNCN